MPDYIKLLTNLKKQLEKGNMSALVGAGFSKNVDSEIFPSWWELISDMVKEYEEGNIKDKFEAQSKEKDYAKYLKLKTEQHIETIGPLRVVSDYMKRKGFRESIDIKIESRTPYVITEKGKKILKYPIDGKFKQKELTKYDLQTHQKLLELPWNNIYTTNYDNLLEECLNNFFEDELKTKIEHINKELEKDQIPLQKNKDELDKKKNEYSRITENENLSIPGSPLVSTSSEQEKSSKKKLEEDINELNNFIFDLERKNKQNVKYSEEASRLLNYTTSIITHSSDLSIKRNSNIIKIHGTIRTDKNPDYGFDGDLHKHYVITEEDYETYPQKHEAFTQLMRISILQESFCLLGFSGVDPNFLAWISWVRDIIHKKNLANDFEKIYLISVGEEDEKDKVLFYQNHRIVNIPLKNSECLIFLNENTNSNLSNKSTNKDFIDAFLDFLSTDVNPSELEIGFELLKQNEYDDSLRDSPSFLDIINKSLHPQTEKVTKNNLKFGSDIIANALEIKRLKYYNRIPKVEDINYHNRCHFLNLLNSFINNTDLDRGKIISLATTLIQDQFLTISIIFYETKNVFVQLKTLAKEIDDSGYFNLIIYEFIDSVWINNKKSIKSLNTQLSKCDEFYVKNQLIYYSILSKIFNLDFKTARKTLDKWNTSEHFQLKKAGILSLFSPKESYLYLSQRVSETIQEQSYQNELLSYLSMAAGEYQERIKYAKRAKEVKNAGLKSIRENLDNHLDEINKTVNKILPYNHDSFKTSKSRSFGGSNANLESVQFLYLLFESGFQLHLAQTVLIKEDRVHNAFKNLYEDFPFPVLFFAFQYTDEKFIIKMAQDYAFSKPLEDKIPIIAKNIERSYFENETPFRYKENSLIFFSEIVNVIAPKDWKNFILEVWRSKLKKQEIFSDRRIYNNYLFEKGFRYIQDLHLVDEIITDILKAILLDEQTRFDFNTAIQLLYVLNFNKEITRKGIELNLLLDIQLINKIIDKLDDNILLIFVLGNIDFALNKSQKLIIKKKLRFIKDFNTSNERVWRIMMLYAKGDEKIIGNIKKDILINNKLWNTGISEDGSYSTSNEFISLYKLRNWKKRKGINWTKDELKEIYIKLKESLNRIEGNVNKNQELMVDYVEILREMDWFITYEEEGLKDVNDFHEIKRKIFVLLIKQREYSETLDAILEINDKEPYLMAINEISYELHNSKLFHKNEDFIGLILNRVLLRVETGFTESLSTISDWFYSFLKEKSMMKFRKTIEKIVSSYCLNPPENIELSFFQEKIIKLAYVLKFWKITNKEIEGAIDLLNTSKFNSIKYNLKYKILKKEED